MVRTTTNLTEAEARERLVALTAKACGFFHAVLDFQDAYDCNTVGLSDWVDTMDSVLDKIKEDIDNTFPHDD